MTMQVEVIRQDGYGAAMQEIEANIRKAAEALFPEMLRALVKERLATAKQVDWLTDMSPDEVKRIRRKVSTSAKDFQRKYGVRARTLECWENGHRTPPPGSCAYLRLIDVFPELVAMTLESQPRKDLQA